MSENGGATGFHRKFIWALLFLHIGTKNSYNKTAQVDSIKKRNVIDSLTDRSWAYDKG